MLVVMTSDISTRISMMGNIYKYNFTIEFTKAQKKKTKTN